ncbi:KilA-N domain-containing protein [Hymenobacter ruber]
MPPTYPKDKAMQELIKKDWNGFEIEFELIDGQLMANATAMCTAFGKRAQHWLDLGQTKRYISALEAKPEIPALVETRQGGSNPGTWINERLILKLAAWLNVDFEIKCDEWVAELLRTGKVEMAPTLPQTQGELILMLAQQNVANEKRLLAVEQASASQQQQVNQIERQVAEVTARVTTVNTDFFTVAGWASLQKKSVPTSTANALGRKAAALSKAQGYDVGKVSDARYGAVNSYHIDVLRQVIP